MNMWCDRQMRMCLWYCPVWPWSSKYHKCGLELMGNLGRVQHTFCTEEIDTNLPLIRPDVMAPSNIPTVIILLPFLCYSHKTPLETSPNPWNPIKRRSPIGSPLLKQIIQQKVYVTCNQNTNTLAIVFLMATMNYGNYRFLVWILSRRTWRALWNRHGPIETFKWIKF